MNETVNTEKIEKANQLLAELASIFPEVDRKTQKMIKSHTSGLSLEYESDGELRLFCVFYDNKTGNYRVTQADVCIVDNLVNDVSFAKAIGSMLDAGIKAGEKISVEDIETIIRKTKLTGVIDSTNERSGI